MSEADAESRFDPARVQGNILRGYHYARVRHLVLEVTNAKLARRWLGHCIDGDENAPQVTTEEQWLVKPVSCFNLGFTYDGMKALGVSKASLASFTTEFKAGMARRAVKINDVGESAPENWAPPFDTPARVHLIASVYADDVAELDRVAAQVRTAGGGKAFAILTAHDGWNFDTDHVHFGYRDSMSQPRFVGVHDPEGYADGQPLVPIGSMLIGYPTEYQNIRYAVPQPDVLGRDGAFNAFRILKQDCAAFEDYLDTAAETLLDDPLGAELLPSGDEAKFGPDTNRHSAMREVIAAKMCGRWRNGVPLELSPDTPNPAEAVSGTDYAYTDDTRCPFGAHMRRCNPRGSTIVQRAARHTRRLVRRGYPYGGRFDPGTPDDEERGLLGNFICASLAGQFEAMMCDWLNLGLQDPRITGSNDPLLGANEAETSWFAIPLKSGREIKLRGFPRFVTVRGGAYTFLASLPAIRYIANLRD